jgi:hypothetical protein
MFDILDSCPLLEELPIQYHLFRLHHYVLLMETGETLKTRVIWLPAGDKPDQGMTRSYSCLPQ